MRRCESKNAAGVPCERGHDHDDGRPFPRIAHFSLTKRVAWITEIPSEAQPAQSQQKAAGVA